MDEKDELTCYHLYFRGFPLLWGTKCPAAVTCGHVGASLFSSPFMQAMFIQISDTPSHQIGVLFIPTGVLLFCSLSFLNDNIHNYSIKVKLKKLSLTFMLLFISYTKLSFYRFLIILNHHLRFRFRFLPLGPVIPHHLKS